MKDILIIKSRIKSIKNSLISRLFMDLYQVLSSIRNMQGPEKKAESQTSFGVEDLIKDLEKGDFGIKKIIKYGFAVYGQSRDGKTASAQLICGNSVKGVKVEGKEMVQIATTKNKNAKIGNTTNSETGVPNFFQVQVVYDNGIKIKAYLVDTPGYGDNLGVLRILSNGYYHYKLYSKVQNMKFILCFDVQSITSKVKQFIDTIVQFTSNFKDYHNHRQDIWQSCAFLFTKVEQNQNCTEDLRNKLKSILNQTKIQYQQSVANDIKEFIRYILKEDRLFYIRKYYPGETGTRGDLLKQIDKKISKWWSRQMSKEKPDEVDMSPVVFSITRPIVVQIMRSDKSKRQFIEVMDYYNSRINQIFASVGGKSRSELSLGNVINQLVKDAMGDPKSCKFLNVMKQYITKYYRKYDPSYNEERKIQQKQLFALEKQSLSASKIIPNGVKSKKTNSDYIVKKFNALQNIEKIKRQINYKGTEQKTIKIVDEYSQALYTMIKEFNRISYKRDNIAQIIYKYGYIIHRIISQAKVLLLLMRNAADESRQNLTSPASNQIRDVAEGKFIELIVPLKDFMGSGYNYKNQTQIGAERLQQIYVKNVNLNDKQYKDLTVNQNLINFFYPSSVEQEGMVPQKAQQLLIKYSLDILQENQHKLQISSKQIQKLVRRLTEARVSRIELYQLCGDQEMKSYHLITILKLTQILGKVLQLVLKYPLARRVYDTIEYVENVCKIFKLQIDQLEKTIKQEKQESIKNRKSLFTLRVDFGKYLAEHARQKQAVIVFQQAYQLASTTTELKQTKIILKEWMCNQKDQKYSSNYEEHLFDEDLFFRHFDEQLKSQLFNLKIKILNENVNGKI